LPIPGTPKRHAAAPATTPREASAATPSNNFFLVRRLQNVDPDSAAGTDSTDDSIDAVDADVVRTAS
jgi:hypothetical protein